MNLRGSFRARVGVRAFAWQFYSEGRERDLRVFVWQFEGEGISLPLTQ